MCPRRAFPVIAAVTLRATLSDPTDAWQPRAAATDAARDRVVGLLNIPDIIGGGCGPAMPSRRDVFGDPKESAPIGAISLNVRGRSKDGGTCDAATVVLHSIHTQQDVRVPTDESDYEVPALIVHARAGEWFRVALTRSSGWVRGTSEDFLPYPDLLVQRLAYIRKHWDGQLWSEPDGVARRVPAEWRAHLADDITADVLAVSHHGPESWIQVRLLAESCGETVPRVRSITGWIRAYAPSGRTAAWFYSRGC